MPRRVRHYRRLSASGETTAHADERSHGAAPLVGLERGLDGEVAEGRAAWSCAGMESNRRSTD